MQKSSYYATSLYSSQLKDAEMLRCLELNALSLTLKENMAQHTIQILNNNSPYSQNFFSPKKRDSKISHAVTLLGIVEYNYEDIYLFNLISPAVTTGMNLSTSL